MAQISLHRNKLNKNYDELSKMFLGQEIDWGIVTKLLCGNEEFLKVVLDLGVDEVMDSRVSNLKKIKEIDPDVKTVYIKPPAKDCIEEIIQYADISFNTQIETIRSLDKEAKNANAIHKIIIMVELGDLREGVLEAELSELIGRILPLENIKIQGIGTNLNCLSGVMPSVDKLIQLKSLKEKLEKKFSCDFQFISGGTTVTLPLLNNKKIPEDINHFRIGEGIFFGQDLVNKKTFKNMHDDVFTLKASIIELRKKPQIPFGELGQNPSGDVFDLSGVDETERYRAIIDVGLLDINPDFLIPLDQNIKVIGASSDMLVLDLGSSSPQYKVGDSVQFKIKYMGALGLLNSNYIEKIVV